MSIQEKLAKTPKSKKEIMDEVVASWAEHSDITEDDIDTIEERAIRAEDIQSNGNLNFPSMSWGVGESMRVAGSRTSNMLEDGGYPGDQATKLRHMVGVIPELRDPNECFRFTPGFIEKLKELRPYAELDFAYIVRTLATFRLGISGSITNSVNLSTIMNSPADLKLEGDTNMSFNLQWIEYAYLGLFTGIKQLRNNLYKLLDIREYKATGLVKFIDHDAYDYEQLVNTAIELQKLMVNIHKVGDPLKLQVVDEILLIQIRNIARTVTTLTAQFLEEYYNERRID